LGQGVFDSHQTYSTESLIRTRRTLTHSAGVGIFAGLYQKHSWQKVQGLTSEPGMLRQSRDRVFMAPPLPWIEERVATLQEVLERRTEKSALLLRKLLGKIRLEPIKPEVGRPYLRARSQLQTLALLEIEPDAKEGERGLTAPDAGSTSLRW